MKIKRVEMIKFKRFTHLTVKDIPQTAKLVILVGQNGSGKTSFLEAFNQYYNKIGFNIIGDKKYLYKGDLEDKNWSDKFDKMFEVQFYDDRYSNTRFANQPEIRSKFYFRSAYRNEPDFQVSSMNKQDDPTTKIRFNRLIQNDQTVLSNYQRLVETTIREVYDNENNNKTIQEIREELIGVINASLSNIFDGLKVVSLGDPLTNGSFYFDKENGVLFHYCNLSAGEKAVFDLILDIVIKSKYYKDAIYCIDEPELHIHTALQGKLLRELYNLIPENSQLWIATHSIGMLHEAQIIDEISPQTVSFLDFDDRDYDLDQVITPTKIDRTLLNRFYDLAFGDYAKLVLPKTVVFCEGDSNGAKRKDFDRDIYTQIFSNYRPDTVFLSFGSCNDIENLDSKLGDVMSKLLANTLVVKLVDRDDRTKEEIESLNKRGIRTLTRRNIESYLLDDSIIKKLCVSLQKENLFEDCIRAKNAALADSFARGNQQDDLKSASGQIYTELKRILRLTQCGNDTIAFLKYTMAPLITNDTEVYKELDNEIFGNPL